MRCALAAHASVQARPVAELSACRCALHVQAKRRKLCMQIAFAEVASGKTKPGAA